MNALVSWAVSGIAIAACDGCDSIKASCGRSWTRQLLRPGPKLSRYELLALYPMVLQHHPTATHKADALTKAMTPAKFIASRALLGMVLGGNASAR